MKAHIGVDARSGLVHSVVGTAANVADVTQVDQLLHGAETYVSGDAGYTGAAKRPEHAERDVIWSTIDRPDGSVSLFSRAKLQERNIAFKEKHSTNVDISEVGGDDQVYFSLESGHEPQKGQSRFGDRMLRFELYHPAFVKTGVMTLVDLLVASPASADERFDAIINHFRVDPDDEPFE